MSVRHLVSLSDLGKHDIQTIVERASELADCVDVSKTLAEKIVGIYFAQTSTRTRSSFIVGALRLGACCVSYGPHDLQTNTGETIEDTTRVLSQYLDGLVIRTAEGERALRLLADQNRMAVINAMNADEHPTQAIADLVTIRRHFGALEGVSVLYIGEGNSTAAALALALSRVPQAKLTLLTPPGYGLTNVVLKQAEQFAKAHGANVLEFHGIEGLPRSVDVVYTTRWQTTGTAKADPTWRQTFAPFRVSADLMSRAGKQSGAVFMHDLPAVRGEEVDGDVLDGSQSIAFRQAGNKLYAAMAALEWALMVPSQ